MTWTPERRARQAERIRERNRSPEMRAKISAAMKGKPSPLRGQKRPSLSAALRGRKFTAEHRANMGVAQMGRARSEETKAKLRELFPHGSGYSSRPRASADENLQGVERSERTVSQPEEPQIPDLWRDRTDSV